MSGISSFVLIFCVYPIAVRLFAKANMSKRLLPAVFCYSVWTVATVAPGSAQAPNLIPTQYLGTSAMAGLLPGYVFAVTVGVIDTVFIMICARRLTARNIVFEDTEIQSDLQGDSMPGLIPALIPLVVIILSFNLLDWEAELALFVGVFLAIILFFPRLKVNEWVDVLSKGASTSVGVLVNTAVIVGFGTVVIQTPLYSFVLEWVSGASINPYLLAAIAANLFALILGSATSSVNLSIQTLGPVFMAYGAQGYNIGYIHRILSQAAMGLDSLPHCGALLAVFNVCGMDHKRSYSYVGFCTVLCPLVVTFCIQVPLCILLGTP